MFELCESYPRIIHQKITIMNVSFGIVWDCIGLTSFNGPDKLIDQCWPDPMIRGDGRAEIELAERIWSSATYVMQSAPGLHASLSSQPGTAAFTLQSLWTTAARSCFLALSSLLSVSTMAISVKGRVSLAGGAAYLELAPFAPARPDTLSLQN